MAIEVVDDFGFHADVPEWNSVPGAFDYEVQLDLPLDVLSKTDLLQMEKIDVAYDPQTDVMRFYGNSVSDLEFAVAASTSGTRPARVTIHTSQDW